METSGRASFNGCSDGLLVDGGGSLEFAGNTTHDYRMEAITNDNPLDVNVSLFPDNDIRGSGLENGSNTPSVTTTDLTNSGGNVWHR